MSQKHPDFERLVKYYVRLWGPSEVLDIVARETTSALRDGALADVPPGQETYTFEVMTPDATISCRCAVPRESGTHDSCVTDRHYRDSDLEVTKCTD
jgi:hypothetical protein